MISSVRNKKIARERTVEKHGSGPDELAAGVRDMERLGRPKSVLVERVALELEWRRLGGSCRSGLTASPRSTRRATCSRTS